MIKIQPPIQPVRPATVERAAGVSSQRDAEQAAVAGPLAAHATTTKDEIQRTRASRIEELEIALKSGTYRPDPDLVATRMVEASAFFQAIDQALAEETPNGDDGN